MARSFVEVSSQYLTHAAALVTAYPFTWLAFALADDSVGQNPIVEIGTAGAANRWSFLLRDNDVLRFQTRDASSAAQAETTNSMVVGEWVTCAAIGTSATSRRVILNGDWASSGTDATNLTPVPTQTDIGRFAGGPTHFDGLIAHVAIYDIDLTQSEIESHGLNFVSPEFIRPNHLIHFWEFFQDDLDHVGGIHLTPSGSPTFGAHSRVVQPASHYTARAPAAAAVVTTPPRLRGRWGTISGRSGALRNRIR